MHLLLCIHIHVQNLETLRRAIIAFCKFVRVRVSSHLLRTNKLLKQQCSFVYRNCLPTHCVHIGQKYLNKVLLYFILD